LFHADGRTDEQTGRQTDMTKLIDAFRNFADAPKNVQRTAYRHPPGQTIFESAVLCQCADI